MLVDTGTTQVLSLEFWHMGRNAVRPNPDYTRSLTLLITVLNFEFENVVVKYRHVIV
jgi:hypothetical protein